MSARASATSEEVARMVKRLKWIIKDPNESGDGGCCPDGWRSKTKRNVLLLIYNHLLTLLVTVSVLVTASSAKVIKNMGTRNCRTQPSVSPTRRPDNPVCLMNQAFIQECHLQLDAPIDVHYLIRGIACALTGAC